MEKRLAYLCGSDSWGGLEMNQMRSALWMKERGHEVVILTWENSPLHIKSQENGLHCVIICKHKKYYDIRSQMALYKNIKKFQISHLIVRATRDMSLAAGVKQRMGKNLHLSYFMEMQLGVKKDDFLHSMRFKRFDLWACPLQYLMHQVKNMTRLDSSKIKYIPSGMDLPKKYEPYDKKDFQKKLNLPDAEIYIGLIGRIDCQKGQNLLLDAFISVSKCEEFKHDVKLCFVGEPTKNEGDEYYHKLLNKIKDNNLQDKVTILPYTENPEDFYKAMDWTVMASKSETFGMVSVESLAYGTPVIGSNRGGTPEILEQGEKGVLFQTMDEYDLSRKIMQIANKEYEFDPKELHVRALDFDKDEVCALVEEALNLV